MKTQETRYKTGYWFWREYPQKAIRWIILIFIFIFLSDFYFGLKIDKAEKFFLYTSFALILIIYFELRGGDIVVSPKEIIVENDLSINSLLLAKKQLPVSMIESMDVKTIGELTPWFKTFLDVRGIFSKNPSISRMWDHYIRN